MSYLNHCPTFISDVIVVCYNSDVIVVCYNSCNGCSYIDKTVKTLKLYRFVASMAHHVNYKFYKVVLLHWLSSAMHSNIIVIFATILICNPASYTLFLELLWSALQCTVVHVQAIGYNVIILGKDIGYNYYESKYNYFQLGKLIIVSPDSGNVDWCA